MLITKSKNIRIDETIQKYGADILFSDGMTTVTFYDHLNPAFPRYKETAIVTVADKICAIWEICNKLFQK